MSCYRFAAASLLVLIYLVTLATPLRSQSSFATLSGAVEDPAGAAVPNVKVSLVKQATGSRRQTVTNRDGYFILPRLEPGIYTLQAYHTGFAIVQVPNITLNTSDERGLRIKMILGSVQEAITVEADSNGIDTSPGNSTVVDRQFTQNMPLNGRSFQSLLLLTPGVNLAISDGGLSINGMRTNANYFTIDGVSANVSTSASLYNGPTFGNLAGNVAGNNAFGGTQGLLSVDALEEFKVQTSSYSAEFGRQPGGQIQLTSRSGTNDFHGTFYDYLRNDIFNAQIYSAPPFSGQPSPPPAKERQNDFGFTLGGPFRIPRFYNGKNRTFFFFSYEGLRLSQPESGQGNYVPSLDARNGNVACNPDGPGGSCGSTSDFSQIPGSLRALLQAFPLPTGPATIGNIVVTTPTLEVIPNQLTGSAPYNVSTPHYTNTDSWSLRMDHNFNPRLIAFLRASGAPSSDANVVVVDSLAATYYSQTDTVGVTYLITNQISNDFRANFSENYGSSVASLVASGGGKLPPRSDWGPQISGAYIAWLFLESIQPAQIGTQSFFSQHQLNFTDNLGWMREKHFLQFGFDDRYLFPHVSPQNYTFGAQFYTKFSLGVPMTGNQSMPAADAVSVNQNDPMTLVYKNLSIYAQDAWRASSRLTLDYGLRWEFNPPPRGTQAGDLRYVSDWQNPADMTLLPAGTLAYRKIYHDFAPRLGGAYALRSRPGWETVLRAGAGIYYDLGNSTAAATAGAYPHQRSTSYPVLPNTSVPYPFSSYVYAPPSLNVVSAPYPSGSTFNAVIDSYHSPSVEQWSLTLQQALGNAQTVSVSYVGNAGRHLLRTLDYTENGESGGPFNSPNFPQAMIYVTQNQDYSSYNALQIEFQRRMSQGLQVLADYTWSHAIDTNSSDYNLLDIYSMKTPAQTYGNSDNDLRHVFNTALDYEVPATSPTGSSVLNTLENVFVNHWAIDGIFRAQSGSPMTVVIDSEQPYGNGPSTFRVDVRPGIPQWLPASGQPAGKALNPNAFNIPVSCLTPNPFACQNGDLGRNTLRGLASYQLDLTARRIFPLSEKVKLEFRADMLNVLNHPTWGTPDTVLGFLRAGTLTSNSTFGAITNTIQNSVGGGLAPIYQFGGPRQIQFALKFRF